MIILARTGGEGCNGGSEKATAIEDGAHRLHRPPPEAEHQIDMFNQKRKITIRKLIRVVCAIGTAALVVAARAQNQDGRVESYTLPPDRLQRAIEYARARHILYFAGTTWDFVVLGLILALNLGRRYRTWAETATQKRVLQAYLFAPLLLLTIDLL